MVFANSLLAPFRDRKLIFVHIPKNAGTSVAESLFGRSFGHHTAKFYRDLDPEFYQTVPTFAILRDPIDRFISAYYFMMNGGGDAVPLYAPWRGVYDNAFANVDDFIAAHKRACLNYRKLDYVMRPQREFVTDDEGKVIVDHLFLLGRDDRELQEFLATYGVPELPVINKTKKASLALTRAQKRFVHDLYPQDFELIANFF